MKKTIHLYNDDSLSVLNSMVKKGKHKNFFDAVITSPPYSYDLEKLTGKKGNKKDFRMSGVYSEAEYIKKTIEYFKAFDNLVKNNGLVIWNLSYFADNPGLPVKTMASVMNRKDLNWTLIDTISWFKNTYRKDIWETEGAGARLGRVVELIFVFARKNKKTTEGSNKHFTSSYKIFQKEDSIKYTVNQIDTSKQEEEDKTDKILTEVIAQIGCPTTATYGESLIRKLLNIYKLGERNEKKPWSNILDPFAGTGTTGLVCMEKGLNFYGMEMDTHCVAAMVYRFRQKFNSNEYDIYINDEEEPCIYFETNPGDKRKPPSKCSEINERIKYGVNMPLLNEERPAKIKSGLATVKKPDGKKKKRVRQKSKKRSPNKLKKKSK